VAVQDEPVPEDTSEPERVALALGQRVGRFLALNGDEKAAALWPELRAALDDLVRMPALAEAGGNPWRWKPLRALADKKKRTAAQQLLSAFQQSGELIPAFTDAPKVELRYQGRPDDVVAQAELLFRHQRALTVDQLAAFHIKAGGMSDRLTMLAQLYAADWNRDEEELYPLASYTTGNELWARHDRAAARAALGDEQAAVQVKRLLDAIKPAVFEDITDIDPQHGWIPLELVSDWASDTLNQRLGPIVFERVEGLIQVRGRSYTGLGEDTRGLTAATLAFLGYLNHDPEMFKPPRPRRAKGEPALSKEERAAQKRSIAEEREKIAAEWRAASSPSTSASARPTPPSASSPRAPGGLGPPPGDPRAELAGLEVARRHPVHAPRLPRPRHRQQAQADHPRQAQGPHHLRDRHPRGARREVERLPGRPPTS
jgi:hypothetical protein